MQLLLLLLVLVYHWYQPLKTIRAAAADAASMQCIDKKTEVCSRARQAPTIADISHYENRKTDTGLTLQTAKL